MWGLYEKMYSCHEEIKNTISQVSLVYMDSYPYFPDRMDVDGIIGILYLVQERVYVPEMEE
jgi:hypothetical protein